MKEIGDELILTGAWFLLLGTLTSAVGVSSKKIISEDFGKSLFAKGNAIEAFGNTIQAIGREKLYKMEMDENELTIMMGSWIQAAGNSTNTIATTLERQGLEEEGHQLNAIGSVIQAIGAQIETTGALKEDIEFTKIEAYGNELIAIGALIDGIGNVALLNDKVIIGDQLLLFGSWIQVFGSILIVYSLLKIKELEESEHHNEYRYGYCPNKINM